LDDKTFTITLGNNDTELRKNASKDYISFWENQAKKLSWFKTWDKGLEWNPPFAKWFVGGLLNASYNTLDIHQESKSNKIAILWEGENAESRSLTYKELWTEVKKFSNVLKKLGVKKGDRVTLYLPMVPELPISMLACSRIGATHTVVFSGFSSNSLKDRIEDSKSKIVITADGGYRRGSIVELKKIVDDAIKDCDFVENVIVLERTKNNPVINSKDKLWSGLMKDVSDDCVPEQVDSTHPLYILYTSGTTGKPKGVLHGTGGYLTHLHTLLWLLHVTMAHILHSYVLLPIQCQLYKKIHQSP